MNFIHTKKKAEDLPTRIIGSFTDELDNIAVSIQEQITGSGTENRENPIVEAMQETSEELKDDKNVKEVKANQAKRFYIRSKAQLEEDLKKIQREDQERLSSWREDIDRQMKIVEPGEEFHGKNVIPLTSKPKRGKMPGMPGTSKSGNGMEVVKSKQ